MKKSKSVKEEKKTFSKKEIYSYLQYIMYCNYYEVDPFKNTTLTNYYKFLEETSIHIGDCTNHAYSCLRCQLHEIEIESQRLTNLIWDKTYKEDLSNRNKPKE